MDKKIIQYALIMLSFATFSVGCSDSDEWESSVDWFPLGAEWTYFSCPNRFFYTVVGDTLGIVNI